MSDARSLSPLFLLGIAVGALWWFYCQEDEKPTYNKVDAVWSDIGYNPYAWWSVHTPRKDTYEHVYPSKIAANCLPIVLSNEEGALSTTEIQGSDQWNG